MAEVNPNEAVAGGDKPKNKRKGTGKYEGVRLYTDVTGKDIKATKRQLLKEMALAGNAGMKSILNDGEREGYADAWDRADAGVNMGTTDATLAAIDAERARMMGGLDVARGQHGTAHSKAMDRMAARNVQYADAMRHAAKLSRDALKKEIAAMKLAASQRAGGGGGGGYGGGSPGIISAADTDTAAAKADRLAEIFNTSTVNLHEQGASNDILTLSLNAIEGNQELTLEADRMFQQGLAQGYSPNEMVDGTYQELRNRGVSYVDALAISHTIGQNYAADTNVGRIINTSGGMSGVMQNVIPGYDSLMQFMTHRGGGSGSAVPTPQQTGNPGTQFLLAPRDRADKVIVPTYGPGSTDMGNTATPVRITSSGPR